jgi:redox-sensing transcriptional repressor
VTPGSSPEESRASDSTVRRLSGYYRILGEIRAAGETTVASSGLARKAGVSPAQVRKDLSFFGQFGKRGTGYDVARLEEHIRSILGLTRRWKVGLVGAGNMAHALYAYKRFAEEGFEIRAIFDNAPDKIGQAWNGLTVQALGDLPREVKEKGLEIGIITTPAEAAQGVAELLVAAGIRGILNFAPRKLFVPKGVTLRNVNLAIELESLSFALK